MNGNGFLDYVETGTPNIEHQFLGALLGAGASLVSGLFGRSDAKKKEKAQKKQTQQAIDMALEAEKVPVITETSSSIDIAKMRNEAEKAGFNPLSVLRAGGLSGYINTYNKVTGEKAGLAAQLLAGSPVPEPAPSLGSVFAGALSTGVSLYNDYAAKVADSNLQRDLQSAYLQGNRSRNAPSSSAAVFGIPRVTSSGVRVQNAVPSLGKQQFGPSKSEYDGRVAGEQVLPTFLGMRIPKDLIPADTYEKWFGEGGGFIGGLANIAYTVNRNLADKVGSYGPNQFGEITREKVLTWMGPQKVNTSRANGNRYGNVKVKPYVMQRK